MRSVSCALKRLETSVQCSLEAGDTPCENPPRAGIAIKGRDGGNDARVAPAKRPARRARLGYRRRAVCTGPEWLSAGDALQ